MGCCCFSGLHSARIIAEIRTFVLLCSTSSSWSGDSGAHDSVLVTVMDFPDKYTAYTWCRIRRMRSRWQCLRTWSRPWVLNRGTSVLVCL